jgi:serine/threonine protein kinase
MSTSITDIPAKARNLTTLGDKTTKATVQFYGISQKTLFNDEEKVDLSPLGEALIATNWSDTQAAKLIDAYHELTLAGRVTNIKLLARWAQFHPDDADTVRDCMSVEPPDGIEVLQVLSRRGSQKLVFLATWRFRQQEVVLKQILAKGEHAERIFSRELQPHPLSMVHPNIIETHFLQNRKGEKFLVERRLTEVLDDNWDAGGVHEAANLLFDMAKALKFLHEHHLIHGDVKPDNIGRRGSNYVLLDFGICRDRELFTHEATPTGSLRTRAPELFIEEEYVEPEKVDVWALGATVYKSVTGRFPLVKVEESIPRISNAAERKTFEAVLKERVQKDWCNWVTLGGVPQPLKEVLNQMLTRDPKSRISTSDLIRTAEHELSAFLRSTSPAGDSNGRFSPLDEIGQIESYLTALANNVSLIPQYKRQSIYHRIRELETKSFGENEKERISRLAAVLQ